MKGIVWMKFVSLFKGKLIVVALLSVAVVGGATAFAATSAGKGLVHALTGQAHATATPEVQSHGNHLQANNHYADKSNKNTCPGLPDAQQLATQFALSTDSASADIQAVCVAPGGLHRHNPQRGISFFQAGLWLRRDRSTADLCAIPGGPG